MSQLKYRPLDETFAETLIPIWSDDAVIKYTNIKTPCTLDEIHGRIKILKEFNVFVVIEEGNVIGIIGCPCINKEELQFGLFYQFCKSSWGQGHAKKATEWLLEVMKQKYNRITIFAEVVTDNIASEKILQHFGFLLFSDENTFERDGIFMKIHSYRLCL